MCKTKYQKIQIVLSTMRAFDELLVDLLLDSQEIRSEIFNIWVNSPEANQNVGRNDCALKLDQVSANKMVFPKHLEHLYQSQRHVVKRCLSVKHSEALWDNENERMPPPKLYVPRGPQSHHSERQSTRRKEYNRMVGSELHAERMKTIESYRRNTR